LRWSYFYKRALRATREFQQAASAREKTFASRHAENMNAALFLENFSLADPSGDFGAWVARPRQRHFFLDITFY
jgi:hypothetical protein